jgi:hypothetical protein
MKAKIQSIQNSNFLNKNDFSAPEASKNYKGVPVITLDHIQTMERNLNGTDSANFDPKRVMSLEL